MGPSYLKRCTMCKQCTLVWTQSPDMFCGFATSVTGPGHNCFLRVYGYFWFIFALGNWLDGQNPNLGRGGVFMGGVCPLRTNNKVRDGGKHSIDRNFRSNQHCDRMKIRFRSRFNRSNCSISIRSKCEPRNYYPTLKQFDEPN